MQCSVMHRRPFECTTTAEKAYCTDAHYVVIYILARLPPKVAYILVDQLLAVRLCRGPISAITPVQI